MEGSPWSAHDLRFRNPSRSSEGGPVLDLHCVALADPGVLHPIRGILRRVRNGVGLPALPHGVGSVVVRTVQVLHQRVLAGGNHRDLPARVRGKLFVCWMLPFASSTIDVRLSHTGRFSLKSEVSKQRVYV